MACILRLKDLETSSSQSDTGSRGTLLLSINFDIRYDIFSQVSASNASVSHFHTFLYTQWYPAWRFLDVCRVLSFRVAVRGMGFALPRNGNLFLFCTLDSCNKYSILNSQRSFRGDSRHSLNGSRPNRVSLNGNIQMRRIALNRIRLPSKVVINIHLVFMILKTLSVVLNVSFNYPTFQTLAD